MTSLSARFSPYATGYAMFFFFFRYIIYIHTFDKNSFPSSFASDFNDMRCSSGRIYVIPLILRFGGWINCQASRAKISPRAKMAKGRTAKLERGKARSSVVSLQKAVFDRRLWVVAAQIPAVTLQRTSSRLCPR